MYPCDSNPSRLSRVFQGDQNLRILAIGGSGFIGSHILRYLSALSISGELFGTYYKHHVSAIGAAQLMKLDVRDKNETAKLIDKLRPNLVFLAFGTQSIEFCKENPKDAHLIHVTGTRNILQACQRHPARLVYVSTDCVFDGSKNFYFEHDPTNPFNMYGQVKIKGEELMRESGLDYIIARASLLFGFAEKGQTRKYMMRVLDKVQKNERIQVAINLHNTPLEIDQAVRAIVELGLKASSGIYHIAGKDRISRSDFAKLVFESFGFNLSLLELIEDRSGLRQENSCLNCVQTEQILGWSFENLTDGIKRVVIDMENTTKT